MNGTNMMNSDGRRRRALGLVLFGVVALVAVSGAPVYADECNLADNGSQTVSLPPLCPGGYSNNDLLITLTDGLPEDGALRVLLSTGAFNPASITRTPDGDNEIEQANFSGSLNFTGVGSLSGLTSIASLSAGSPVFKTRRIGPAPTTDQQMLDTEVLRMTGSASTLFGWFQSFTIQGGSEFGFNSPGELTVVLNKPGNCVGGGLNGQPCAREDQCPDSNFNGTCQGGTRDGLPCTSNLACPGLGAICLNPGACLCSGAACPAPTYLTKGYYDVTMTISWVTKSTAPTAIRNRSGSETVTVRIRTGAFASMYMVSPGTDNREINANPGDEIQIEARCRDLAPTALTAYQVTLPHEITPLPGGAGTIFKDPANIKKPVIDTTKTDWVFIGVDPAPLTQTALMPDHAALALNINPPDPPVIVQASRYLARFTFFISPNAGGDFVISFVDPGIETNSRTVLADPNRENFFFDPYPFIVHVSCVQEACAALYANDPCNDGECIGDECVAVPVADGTPCDDEGNTCTDDECRAGECDHPSLPDGTACDDGDACTLDDECAGGNCVGTPDALPFIVHGLGGPGETSPCSGYIDPRIENLDVGDLTPKLGVGVTRPVRLVFSEPVFAIGGGPVGPGSFTVLETPGAGVGPAVTVVNPVSATTFELTLARIPTFQQWTTIIANVEDACGNLIVSNGDQGPGVEEPDRLDFAFLPGNINQDAQVTPTDLINFRQRIASNYTSPCDELLYFDIDRDGAFPLPTDLIKFRQILGGAPPATRTWGVAPASTMGSTQP